MSQLPYPVIPLTNARREFGALVEQVLHKDSRFIIERQHKPVACLVSMADMERLVEIEHKEASRLMRKALKDTKRLIPLEDAAKKLRV